MSVQRRGRPRRARFEPLERRELLDGQGLVWGVDARLSLSFVPDGTQIGPQTSSLFEKLDELAPRQLWQDAILRGFQTWARHTNADIAVVRDDGSDLGIAGATKGDPRFGDVRITAIPMASDVFATSIPTDEFVDGTWVGDVFFNSNADIQTIDDLYAIALHEAGHVFGLVHNGDVNSPLHQHGIPISTTPTEADIRALQDNFGLRIVDQYESPGEEPTEIEMPDDNGVAWPGIVFGDISSASDIDYFDLEGLDKDPGPLSVRLITGGISSIKATISVLTRDGLLLGESTHSDATEQGQLVKLATLPPNVDELRIRVASENSAPFDVGAYTVVATLDDVNSVPDGVIDEIARSRIRELEQEDIQRFFGMEFDDDDEVFVDDDDGSDDQEGKEIELRLDNAFTGAQRFTTTNAISNPGDIDRFEIRVPSDQQNEVMTISLASLTDSFRGYVRVRDDHGNEVALNRMTNNDSSSIAQVGGVKPNDRYTFEVRQHELSSRSTGNYELAIRFGNTEALREAMLAGTLASSEARDEHSLRVFRTQLFQFGLAGDGLSSAMDRLRTRILDVDRNVVETIEAVGGELETRTVLLGPGDYSLEFSTSSPAATSVSYRLSGTTVDEPLGPEPVDPTEDPFCGFEWLTEFLSCFRLIGDLDGDGTVSFRDFLTLANNFGQHEAQPADGDLDGDTVVGFGDFLLLSENYGKQIPGVVPSR